MNDTQEQPVLETLDQIDEIIKEGETPAVEQKPVDPAAHAAHQLQGALPYFKHMVMDKIMGTQAKKLLVALAEVPFNEIAPEFTTKDQEAVYQLGQQIMNAKFLILMASLRDSANKKQEATEEKKEGTENG